MSDYEEMNDKQLEKANQDLQKQIASLSAEQDKLAAVRDKRSAEAYASRTLEGLSPTEMHVLIKAAQAGVGAAANSPGGGK